MTGSTRMFMEQLALSFPTLRQANGTKPFEPALLEAWACGPEATSGGLYAAQFVLGVYNCFGEWRCGRFDLFRAVSTWDPEHAKAFAKWADDPRLA
ncbi:MAG TPA: hypothetical protein VFF73_14415 [Planctomycetota bacterium]|nr:hypothetical protein [Planctomycetota bacterium]